MNRKTEVILIGSGVAAASAVAYLVYQRNAKAVAAIHGTISVDSSVSAGTPLTPVSFNIRLNPLPQAALKNIKVAVTINGKTKNVLMESSQSGTAVYNMNLPKTTGTVKFTASSPGFGTATKEVQVVGLPY